MSARIALISAVGAAIAPAQAALDTVFDGVDVWNILDDRLLVDANARGGLDEGLRRRMDRLIDHAIAEGADGVLLTCSMYGAVAQERREAIPVLASDQAAFDDIAAGGFGRVLVVASFDGARDDSVARLRDSLMEAGSDTRLEGVAVPAAMDATRSGDHAALVAALTDALRDLAPGVDAVFLAQYSLAPAGEQLGDALGLPVLSGPASSARTLRGLIGQSS